MTDIYDFILAHEHEDTTRMLLEKHAGISDMKWIVQQIEGRKVSRYKIPSFYAKKYIHYPKKLSLEQCSSEATAIYKASLIQGNTLIDLTTGFGVDTVFFSKNFERVVCLEQNPELVSLCIHNLSVMDIHNIEIHCTDAISFLKKDTDVYSWMYIDPARRNSTGKKVFMLSDCEPDILSSWNLLVQKAKNILIKTSPLLDIKQVWENLPVTATHVIAVKNEVKEVLYSIEHGKNVSDMIICADINEHEYKTFKANLLDEQNLEVQYAIPKKYLYEPNKAILKAGLFKAVAQQYSLFKIAPNSHLYTADTYVPYFMGRIFEVNHILPYQKKVFQELNSAAFNIIARNFPDTPEQIAKKLSVCTGGETRYLIATRDNRQKAIIILAERLH